MQRKDR